MKKDIKKNPSNIEIVIQFHEKKVLTPAVNNLQLVIIKHYVYTL